MKDAKKSFLIRSYIVLLVFSLAIEVHFFPPRPAFIRSVPFSIVVFVIGLSFCLIFYRDFLCFLRERKIIFVFMGLFLFSGIISSLLSPFPAILGLISLFQYVLFFGISLLLLFLFSIEGENVGIFFLKVLVGLAVLLALVSFIEVTNESLRQFLSETFRHGRYEVINGRFRTAATLKHSNIFGCFMSLGMLIIFYLKEKIGLKARVFYPVVAILSVAMVISGSRNAAFVLLAPLFLLLLNRKTAGTIAVLIGIVIFALVILTPSSSRFSDIWKIIARTENRHLLVEEEFNTVATRPWIWQSALTMFRNYPLTGIGPGCCNRAMKDYASAQLFTVEKEKINERRINAHNGFLNILAEFGLMGTAVALAFAVYIVVFLVRHYGLFPPLPVHALMMGIGLSFLPDAFFYSLFYMVIVLTLVLLFALPGNFLGDHAGSVPSDKPAS
ncbi:MAG: O-antigen ligase family protein [Syntrophaceae bacterium]|nr:O-antigen ligase family protein [Syntrophaceae bacterium]